MADKDRPQIKLRDLTAYLGTDRGFVGISGVAWLFQFVFIIWV